METFHRSSTQCPDRHFRSLMSKLSLCPPVSSSSPDLTPKRTHGHMSSTPLRRTVSSSSGRVGVSPSSSHVKKAPHPEEVPVPVLLLLPSALSTTDGSAASSSPCRDEDSLCGRSSDESSASSTCSSADFRPRKPIRAHRARFTRGQRGRFAPMS
ncbi:unnamed protein product [Vitrella brassicaformis CCMP3155]|uniref:Uncharacterized protein n=2 Tax=Vitrella brassicaformis TaxID=1169539 RepID=A0A0G4GB10_VITBC|nr:unnamed protein product [Vitrella brassicaformis CCMP3155]|mmetsp:Transcript_715/g.1510  ORF Transcript_715/g.1510 Transcript_715/m.1510 type:complete len:155 (+) Transcript_715:446-910(+)|eukprot:CEM26330.1 unnamed protein product [Vitrella brassicaformis CCMP3155]